MSRYKKLLANTMLFGIATFSSKLLVFVLMPILTRLFTLEEYGTANIIVNTCNLFLPIVTMCIHEAIIRFGLDGVTKKRDLFTTSILTILVGYLFLLACFPLVNMITQINAYMPFIYLYVFTSALRTIVTNFVRASGFTRLFAIDGIVTTITTITFMLLLLTQTKLGIAGYLLGTILADALSAILLIVMLKLHKFVKIKNLSRTTIKEMLTYSIPLIPTSIFWWVTNLSDQYLVAYISGPAINGLYSAAYRIPTAITLVSTIFIQAWQISAFSETNTKEGAKFFSSVFKSYFTLVFVAASGLILLIKPITVLFLAPSFYEAWRFSPFLVLAVSFSCMVTFLGTIYNVAKRNTMVTITTFIGAVTNIVLNLILIPRFGANGAAFATFFSFFVVFVIRAIDTRRYIDINLSPLRIAASLALLLIQVFVSILEVKYWIFIEIIILILLILCNLGPIIFMIQSIGEKLVGRRAAGKINSD